MPAKIARLATRPPFWIPEVSVAVRSSRPSCSKVEKREYSWQIGSHPGNPGLNRCTVQQCQRRKIALLTNAACASVDRATVIRPGVIPTEEATRAVSSDAKH